MRHHSTVSNQKRMNSLGLKKGDAEGSTPGYRDLDEVMASPQAVWKRPWWVRTVEKPTVEVDWEGMERFDVMKVQQLSWRKYVGEEEAKRLLKLGEERVRQWLLEKKPGQSLRDRALNAGSNCGAVGTSFKGSWNDFGPPVCLQPAVRNRSMSL